MKLMPRRLLSLSTISNVEFTGNFFLRSDAILSRIPMQGRGEEDEQHLQLEDLDGCP